MTPELPPLYGITDPRGSRGLAPAEAARILAEAGVRLVQVRDKVASSGERLARAREAVEVLRGASVLAIVNDRPDVALLSGADGVHLGEDDMPPWAARRVLPNGALVGLSTHSTAAARAAMSDPDVSYVAFGPVFESSTKPGAHPPLGLAALAEAARGRSKPVVAIGGITPDLAAACFDAGADSIAMIAGLLDGDPRANVAAALRSVRRAVGLA